MWRSVFFMRKVHRYSSRHRQLVEKSLRCGCFHCLHWFSPQEIAEWTDERRVSATALCPRCGIDAVLPDNVPGIPLTPELLSSMKKYWF